jgi:hypothetical protein
MCVIVVGKGVEVHVVARTLKHTLVVMDMPCCAQALQQFKASSNA